MLQMRDGRSITQFLLMDRRTSVRFPCDLQVSYRTGGGKTGLWWNAQIRNFSIKGVALIAVRYLPPGTWLTVRLQPKSFSTPFEIQAQVRHVQPDGPGRWYIGCFFLQRLSERTVAALTH